MRSKLPVFAILAIIFVAGCIGQGTRPVRLTSDDGLEIIDFFAEPVSVEAGDTVLFTMQVENVGGTRSRDVVARLFGIEGQWREIVGGPPLIQNIGNLDPPNPDFNQPGDTAIATWIYRTPDLPPGIETNTRVTGELIYTYNTSGVITMRAVGETLLETEYLAKGKTPEGPVVANSFAPVQILVNERFNNYFINVRDDPGDAQEQLFPVLIELVNVGSGFPITDGSPGTIFGTIRLRGPGNPEWQECLGNIGTREAVISPNTLGAEIAKLKPTRGKAVIACTMSLDKDAFMLADEFVHIDFFLEYRYFVQSPLTVRISSFR